MKNLGLWIRSRLRGRKKVVSPLTSTSTYSIGVLLYNPDFSVNPEINRFIRDLQNSGNQVEVICFLDKEVNRLYEFPYTELRFSDISITGGFKKEKINKFLKTRFHYLLSINNSPFLPFENILSKSTSGIRIGKYFPGSQRYLDFMIQLDKNSRLKELISKMNEFIPKLNLHE